MIRLTSWDTTYGRLNAVVLVLALLAAAGWLTGPWLGLA